MKENPCIVALIVAAGAGHRLGGTRAKQYQPIAGKPMLAHSLSTLAAHPAITAVQVVIGQGHEEWYHESCPTQRTAIASPVFGGATRAESVAAGLQALAPLAPDYVLIHDAARPFLSAPMVDALIAALTPDNAALPALPVVDTVRRHQDGAWEEVPRDGLLHIQTPQAFPFQKLLQLVQSTTTPPPPITDEAALWLAAGYKLAYVEGNERLRKVTTAADMHWANRANTRMAVGMGYDVHTLMPAGLSHHMRLGGVDIPHNHKLHGHSDADVVLHAVVDALLGALAEGDIGQHFPPSDPRWKGADSTLFVKEVHQKLIARGAYIQHLDVTIICEAPKIAPHRDAIRTRIAELLEIALTQVSVKATTTEKLGFTGREEGIAAHAVATLSLPESV